MCVCVCTDVKIKNLTAVKLKNLTVEYIVRPKIEIERTGKRKNSVCACLRGKDECKEQTHDQSISGRFSVRQEHFLGAHFLSFVQGQWR